MTGSDKHSNSDAGSSSFKLPYVTDFIEPRKQSGDGTLGSGGKYLSRILAVVERRQVYRELPEKISIRQC